MSPQTGLGGVQRGDINNRRAASVRAVPGRVAAPQPPRPAPRAAPQGERVRRAARAPPAAPEESVARRECYRGCFQCAGYCGSQQCAW